MTAVVLTAGGCIRLPTHVQEGLGVKPGDRLEFIEVEPGRYTVVACNLPVTALQGIVPKPARPVSVAAMNAAIRGRH